MDKNILGRQCIFARHFKSNYTRKDALLVRERIFYDDGSDETKLFMVYDYKRPFYVTDKRFQNHKQKKPYELKERLVEFKCTDSDLSMEVGKALGKEFNPRGIWDHKKSPYLYYTDYSASNLFKREYIDRYPEHAYMPLNVANLDFETNTVFFEPLRAAQDPDYVSPEKIYVGTVDYKDNSYLIMTEEYLDGLDHDEVVKKIRKLSYDNIDTLVDLEIVIVPDERTLIIEIFKKIREYDPDILAIWHILFDMPYVFRRCMDIGIPLNRIVADPRVPVEYHDYYFKEGPEKIFNDDGSVKRPLKNHERHHYVYSAAGYEFTDAMIDYRIIRTGSSEIKSYALDAITKAHGLPGKLKLIDDTTMAASQWHDMMRTTRQPEYGTYAIYDSKLMTDLDNKTLDIKMTKPSLLQEREWSRASSSTNAVAIEYRKHAVNSNRIPASCYNPGAEDMKNMTHTELCELGIDQPVLSGRDWIRTLSATMMEEDAGLPIIKLKPLHFSRCYILVSDLDVTSSYPSVTQALNVERTTSRREIIKLRSVDEDVLRANNINLVIGVDQTRYATEMFNCVELEEILEM